MLWKNWEDLSENSKKKYKLLDCEANEYKMIVLHRGGISACFEKNIFIVDKILAGYLFDYLSLGLWKWRKKNRQILYEYLITDKEFLIDLLDFPRKNITELSLQDTIKADDAELLAKTLPVRIDLNKIRNKEASEFLVYLFVTELSIIATYNCYIMWSSGLGYNEIFLESNSYFYLMADKSSAFFGHKCNYGCFFFGNIKLEQIESNYDELMENNALLRPAIRELDMSNYITTQKEKEMFLFFIKYWALQGNLLKFIFKGEKYFLVDKNFEYPLDMFQLLYKNVVALNMKGPGLSLWWKISTTAGFIISTFLLKIFVNWAVIFEWIYERPRLSFLRVFLDKLYQILAKKLDGENFDGLNFKCDAWHWFK